MIKYEHYPDSIYLLDSGKESLEDSVFLLLLQNGIFNWQDLLMQTTGLPPTSTLRAIRYYLWTNRIILTISY